MRLSLRCVGWLEEPLRLVLFELQVLILSFASHHFFQTSSVLTFFVEH
jgi:hypothetical protein